MFRRIRKLEAEVADLKIELLKVRKEETAARRMLGYRFDFPTPEKLNDRITKLSTPIIGSSYRSWQNNCQIVEELGQYGYNQGWARFFKEKK